MGSFSFKQFHVEQDLCAMKVGTDGVLLGAWVAVDQAPRRILDIGSGTGVIALMMAQRVAHAEIVGVEIDPKSASQARANFDASAWSERLSVEQCAIQDYKPSHSFDLIVSNPPYFVQSLLSPSLERTTARHTSSLSFEELISATLRLLKGDGRLSIILPTQESAIFERAASGVLYLSRRTYVRGKEGGEIKRIMSEYITSPTQPPKPSEISIRALEGSDYTPEYRDITKDFYLKF